MTTTPSPTGRLDGRTVIFTREFRAPATDVWAAVTEPERMQRWIGTWSGDPATREVDFRMTAEGDDVPSERVRILECAEPRRLTLEWAGSGVDWRITIEISETAGLTTLVFAQTFTDGAPVEMVGPGWEYYLERLGAALAGTDVAGVVWDDYVPLTGFYAELGRQIDA